HRLPRRVGRSRPCGRRGRSRLGEGRGAPTCATRGAAGGHRGASDNNPQSTDPPETSSPILGFVMPAVSHDAGFPRLGLSLAVVVFILLCFVGLAATVLVWVAGAHQYGVVSTVWQVIGIKPLIGTGLVAHVGSAVVLSGLHHRESWGYRGLATFGV